MSKLEQNPTHVFMPDGQKGHKRVNTDLVARLEVPKLGGTD